MLNEVAYRMGMPRSAELAYVPDAWRMMPPWFEGTKTAWRNAQYRALGNGVPVWMAKAFGDAAKEIFG